MKKLFYLIKPFIPRRFQLFLRRSLIKRKFHRYQDIWPILKGSEKRPDDFRGWPDGKQFALILTHDVEHQRGYDKVLQLMEVEKSSILFPPSILFLNGTIKLKKKC
jgi:hypothetical protein